jgi:uncharacterized protein involved in exopolysaccharide biosynthesis
MEDDSIDIIALVKTVWTEKKLVLKVVCISFVIGYIVALSSPVVYESETTFVPQTSDKNSSNKGYDQLAYLAGINLNSDASSLDNFLSPLLYSKIIESEEFSLNLINEELIYLNGDRLTIKDYLLLGSDNFNIVGFIKNIVGFIKKYTIGLFKRDKKNEVISEQFLKEYNFISEDDYSIIGAFKAKFSIELNEKEGYIKVLANDKDAFVSTQLVKLVTKNLQSRIISLRTNKIKEQLDYSKEQYKQQKDEFEVLQKHLAEFKDSNKNISTAIFLSELQKLESEYQLQQSILMSLAAEYNNNKIKLNKNTPIFSVLDEVSVPNQRSKPKRKQIVLIYMFLGIIISIGYILAKDPFKEIIQKIKEN